MTRAIKEGLGKRNSNQPHMWFFLTLQPQPWLCLCSWLQLKDDDDDVDNDSANDDLPVTDLWWRGTPARKAAADTFRLDPERSYLGVAAASGAGTTLRCQWQSDYILWWTRASCAWSECRSVYSSILSRLLPSCTCFYRALRLTKYRAAKQYASADGSLTRLYRWCSHFVHASEAVQVTALLLFWPHWSVISGFNFYRRVSY